MTKIVAMLAVALLVLVGAYTGEAATPEGAVFTGVVTSIEDKSDMVITVKQIRDRHGDVVGWGNTVCVRLPNGSSQCQGTFILPKGKISVAGTRRSAAFFVFAITGGTGRYHGWSGSLLGRTVASSPRREQLVFEGLAP